jgi:exopolysaccharide biosynthesis protein
MKHKWTKKAKIIVSSVTAFLIIIGSLAYIAADRFLIEHVEATVSQASAVSSDTQSTASVSTIAAASSSSADYTATDMSYTSDTTKITITKVTAGTDSDPLVYYVADIQLTDATDLKSALAKNEFGTNIIQYVSEMAETNDAILAINGDYYGFREDGIIIRNGVIYRDSPARQGLAIYSDGTMKVYDETATTAEELLASGVYNTLSFGPALLEDGEIISGIDTLEVDTNVGNHSVQGNQPRTGVGIISENHFIFVVADGRNSNYSNGVTMTEFAQIFKDLGCTTAYNLDGGGSSEMVFMGKIINTPCNKNGSERGTSDILYIAS